MILRLSKCHIVGNHMYNNAPAAETSECFGGSTLSHSEARPSVSDVLSLTNMKIKSAHESIIFGYKHYFRLVGPSHKT